MKKVAILVAVLLLGAITIGCGSKKTKPAEPQATVSQKNAIAFAADYLTASGR